MRLDVRHRLKPPSSPAEILARHAWKVGLGVVMAVLLTARGTGPTYTHPHGLATSVVATSVPCGDIKLDAGSADTATWTAVSSPYGTGSPYILPHNDPNLPTTDPSNPNCLTAAKAADEVHVPAGVKLVIDGSQGPVQIFSHGTGIFVNGGQLKTISTDATNTVVFDAEPDVASWDGISISAADAAHRGNASLSFVSIQHALTAITITSGATSSPDNASYGLTVRNSGVGPSYFDGIDATNTPISVTGRVDPLTLRPDGQFGTLNNIGSQGIKVTYDPVQPNYPASVPDKALDVENMTFGSSVPFGEITCVPLQPCAAGSIGNDAIQATFVTGQQPIKLDNNSFFRAGSYGLELANTNNPTITNNIFTCNGSGSPKPVISCVGAGLRYSAVYLSNVTNLRFATGGISNNTGQQNGLDAIGLNGQVVSDLAWQTPTNDANAPSSVHLPHALGYMVANGDLQLVGSKLTVKDGDVVKVKGGAILISSGSLDASSAGLKTFTSLRDNTVGIQACPSVFVQSCPSPLPANEWIGLDLVGATGNIANASILFPTKAVDISGGPASLIGPDGGAYGLVITNSRLGPTFSDSVAVNATPVYISASKFCRIDTIASDPNYLQCAGAGPGDHGINASYSGNPAAGGGLKILGNDVQGSTNEAILGTALGGRMVDIENDTVEGAGSYGMHLVSADNLTLKGNGITGSGTGAIANTSTYAAIYLDGISKADFSGPISGNTGTGNGLDAIAFHGSTADAKPLNWKTVGAGGSALGYLIDGDLAVNGDLTLATGDYAPVLGGAVTVHNGTFSSTGAVLSSLKEQAPHLPSCGSVFVPKISGVCPAAAPGDWAGLILDPGKPNQLTDSEVRYALTGISVGTPTVPPVALNLTMTRSNVRNTASDGVATLSPVSITDGAFTGNAGHGIKVDLTGVSPGSAQQLLINGHTYVGGSGQDGILAIKLGGLVQISGVSVDHAGAFGINLRDAANLTLIDNTVTNSAATYPAIYLNGFSGAFGTIHGNKGAGNGIDAIAFHGTVTDSLAWQTARKTTDPTQPLGYVLDNTLNLQLGNTLTVNAGDIVKVGNGGALNLQGAILRADGTGSSAQKIFTSLTDNSAGVVACPSVLLSGCGPAAPGDWAGINLSGGTAQGTVVNASVRYAGTGISIANGAPSTYGSSSFGLVVSQSRVASSKTDGVFASNTPISVTDSTISGGVHGANVTLSNAPATPAALRLSGNRFMSQSAEAILGQGLFGQPVWITDNRIQNAGTFGIRLLNSNSIVLRNNNIVGSGGGPSAGAGRYPAIYLPNVSADFSRNVRGNVGSGNGLDSIAFDGTVTSNLTWLTPSTNATTQPLGYLLDGGLTLDGTTLTVNHDDVVKALGGPITINGGSLVATGTSTDHAVFTSLKDNASGVAANAVSCPSIFVSLSDCGQPQAGNWGGIVITDKAGQRGNNTITYSQIQYAITGVSIDSGPVTTPTPNLLVTHSWILHTSLDGIRASDTPIDIETTVVGDQSTAVPGTPSDIRGNGVIASFFSPAGCPSPTGCIRLTLLGNNIYSTGKDGIVANGLGGQPTVVKDNYVTVAGTYGIRLVGADQLTLTGNHVNHSGIAANAYPAIYLNNVSGEFNTAITSNFGAGDGLNALVFHGTVNTTSSQPDFVWLTPDPSGVQPLGYMLDGALTVNGNFRATDGIVKMLSDGITINGALTSTRTIYTSLKENTSPFACNSVFVPTACPSLTASDYWGGISVIGGASSFSGGGLRNSKLGLTVSGASLSVTAQAHVSTVTGDAITVKNTTAKSKFEDLTVDHVAGNGIKLVNADATFSRDVFTTVTGTGNYAVSSAGGTATIDCSSFHDNTNGVSFDGTSSINDSDAYGNTTYDVVGTSGTPAATGVWWGTANTGGNVSGVTVTELLSSQSPVFSDPPTPGGKVEILGSNPTATDTPAVRALGIGTMTIKLTSSRRMDPNTAPMVMFNTDAVGDPTRNVTMHVGGTWNDRIWTSNPYPLNTLNATAGLNHLRVAGGKSCIPDGPSTAIAPAPKDFNAAVLPTVVAVQPGATATYGGTTTLSATLMSGGTPVANEAISPLHFTILDAANHPFAAANAGTDGTGLATTAAINVAGLNASPPNYGLTAVFLGDNLYSVSNTDSSQTLVINKVPTVTTSAASAASVKTGTAVTDQAAITGLASTAGGTVMYNLFNTIDCTGSPVFTNTTASFINGVVPAAATWTAMPPATYQWQATYNGDANHKVSTSACGSDSVTVNISTPTIATAVAPTSPVVTGTSVKDQATLTGATSNAGGTVTYKLYSGTVCTGSPVYTSSAALVTNGVVAQSAPSFTATPAGSYTWQATYSGDINNLGPVSSTCGSDPLVVNNVPAVISNVSPVKGTVAGNTPVTISGTNMAGATAVMFGSVAGSIVSVSDNQVQAKSPIEAAGAVDILITTPSGTSLANAPTDQFTFVTYAATVGADAPAIYWRLGDAGGPAVVDASGSARNGTYSATGVAYGVVGALVNDADKAVTLDGVSGAIQEASGAGVPIGSSARSLEIWFKTTTATAQPLFNYGTAGSLSQFAVYLAGAQVQVKDGTETLTVSAASSLADGAWHHLLVTYDGATSVAIYVDGAAVGSSQTTSGTLATVLDVTGLEVGRDNALVPVFFNGTLDEAAIYTTALSAARVAAHFAAGEGG